jgi:hypothetical protein
MSANMSNFLKNKRPPRQLTYEKFANHPSVAIARSFSPYSFVTVCFLLIPSMRRSRGSTTWRRATPALKLTSV